MKFIVDLVRTETAGMSRDEMNKRKRTAAAHWLRQSCSEPEDNADDS